MSEVDAVNANNAVVEENNQNDKSVKGKKAKSPRDRAREESEAITKGISSDVQVEGRRLTRSAAKGVLALATPPPPAKKERKSSTSGGKGRGRPKKMSIVNTDENDSHDESIKDVSATENDEVKKNDSTKNNDATQPIENNSHDKEEIANNNAEASTKQSEATENGAKEQNNGDAAAAPASENGEKKKDDTSVSKEEDVATEADKKNE